MKGRGPKSLAWRGGVLMFLTIALLSSVSVGLLFVREAERIRHRAFSHLRATVDQIEERLLTQIEAIIEVERDQSLARDDKVEAIHLMLQPIVTQIPAEGVGCGYYSRTLDAVVAIVPWDELGYLLGQAPGADHPAVRMYAEGITEQEEIGTVLRGRVARIARLVHRDTEPVGHIWANMPTDTYYAPLLDQLRYFLSVFVLAIVVGGVSSIAIGRMMHSSTSAIADRINAFSADPSSYSYDEHGDLADVPAELRGLARSYIDMIVRVQELLRELAVASRVRALGDLAVAVAHDLRSPLQVIKMNAHLGGEAGGPETNRYFDRISRSADYINELIGRLLMLARAPAERFDQVAVGTLMEELAPLTEIIVRDRDIVIELMVEPGLPEIRADRMGLRQALMNLIANAVDAMPEGGRIEVHAAAADEGLLIAVSDTGPGIPEDIKAEVFKRFFTTKEDGGTGLGLAITESVIANHGGRLWFDSEAGLGTTFYVYLPRDTTQPDLRSGQDAGLSAPP